MASGLKTFFVNHGGGLYAMVASYEPIAAMPNTAPWRVGDDRAPTEVHVVGRHEHRAAELDGLAAADASQSSTVNHTDQAGNSPSPAVWAPHTMSPSTVKIAPPSPLASSPTPQPNTVV